MAETSSTTTYRDALPIGTEINGYTIRGVLGRGGFGTTYHATDQLDQSFAIKEYFPKQFATRHGLDVVASSASEQDSFDDCRRRFLAEAKTLSLLGKTVGDDSIVKVVTFFEAYGTAYIVMEFLSGESLEEVMKRYPKGMPADQLQGILRRVLRALDRVHGAGLVHRDIKPANIFIHETGRPVLIDFGSAREASKNQNTTYTQIFSGGYAPIEQFSGTHQGPFSDIYAVGAVCYRAIGGTLIDSFTRHQAVMRRKPDPLLPALEIGATRYPVGLLRTIDLALAIHAEERPQSAGDLLRILDGARGTDDDSTVLAGPSRPADAATPIAAPAPEPPPTARVTPLPVEPAPAARRNNFRTIAASLVVILMLGAVGAVFGPDLLGGGEAKAWEAVAANPTETGYRSYLQRFPQGAHRGNAEAGLAGIADRAAWTAVAAAPTEAAYQDYATRFPTGAHHADAAAHVAVYSDWLALRDNGTGDQLASLLAAHPDEPFADALRQRLAQVRDREAQQKAQNAAAEWERIKTADDPAALKAFIAAYPGTDMAAEAAKRLPDAERHAAVRAQIQEEAAAWSKVKDSASPAELRAFLATYPDGPNTLNAKARLAALTGGRGGREESPNAQQEKALSQWIAQSKAQGQAVSDQVISNVATAKILRQQHLGVAVPYYGR